MPILSTERYGQRKDWTHRDGLLPHHGQHSGWRALACSAGVIAEELLSKAFG